MAMVGKTSAKLGRSIVLILAAISASASFASRRARNAGEIGPYCSQAPTKVAMPCRNIESH